MDSFNLLTPLNLIGDYLALTTHMQRWRQRGFAYFHLTVLGIEPVAFTDESLVNSDALSIKFQAIGAGFASRRNPAQVSHTGSSIDKFTHHPGGFDDFIRCHLVGATLF